MGRFLLLKRHKMGILSFSFQNEAVISEQCTCVYNGPSGQQYCLKPGGLYTTTTCADGMYSSK